MARRKKNEEAILLSLACGASVESVARQHGIHERTIYRRLEDPATKRRLAEIRTDIVKRTSGALTAAATESIRTLMELQKAPTPPATRLGAARAVLEIGIKIREVADLMERIAALERQAYANPGN